MIYQIPFIEKQAYYIFKNFKNCKKIDKPDSDYIWIELEINNAYDLIELYSSGVLYGLNIKTNINQ
jgi:hypothetical protein